MSEFSLGARLFKRTWMPLLEERMRPARRTGPNGLTQAATVTLGVAIALMTGCGGGADPPTISSTISISPAPPAASAPVIQGPPGLTQLAAFPTLGFAYRYTANSDGSNPQGAATPDAQAPIGFEFHEPDQTYAISIPGFNRGMLVMQGENAGASWYSLSTATSPTFGVVLLRPDPTPSGPGLHYTSYGWWEDPIYTPLPAALRYRNVGSFAYGIPTDPADVPPNGTREFVTSGDGYTSASLGVWYSFGYALLSIDFSARRISGELSLGVNPGGPGHEHFGTYPLIDGQIVAGSSRFTGRFILPDGSTGGLLEGQFTGPQAAEVMARWLVPHPPGQSGVQGSLFGVLVGKAKNN